MKSNFAINIFSSGILRFSQLIERLLSRLQGKGWGTASIKSEVKSCLRLLKGHQLKVAVDIGANQGKYTEELMRFCPYLEHHIFEPSSINFSRLQRLFLGKNVYVNHFALSNESGNFDLHSDSPGSPLASLTRRKLDHLKISMTEIEKVKVERFDIYWSKFNRDWQFIDLVKIDVEGHELNVLYGFGDLIQRVKLIQFEFGGCNIDTKTFFQDFWYFFRKYDFSMFRITPFGPVRIKSYSESHEYFLTTNYIAINNAIINSATEK